METILILANFYHTKFNLAHFYTLVGRRNMASLARLFKLNKDLVQFQKDEVIRIEFGGLFQIAACSMPEDLS